MFLVMRSQLESCHHLTSGNRNSYFQSSKSNTSIETNHMRFMEILSTTIPTCYALRHIRHMLVISCDFSCKPNVNVGSHAVIVMASSDRSYFLLRR